jgi:hypothetical protein
MIMVIIPVMVTTVVVIPAFVARLIFRGPDEVHRPVAGMIFMAVLTPVMSVLRRNVEINGRRRNRVRYRLDRHRLSVQHRWRRFIAQLHLAVDSRRNLSGQNDIEVQFAGATDACARNDQSQKRSQEQRIHFDALTTTVLKSKIYRRILRSLRTGVAVLNRLAGLTAGIALLLNEARENCR